MKSLLQKISAVSGVLIIMGTMLTQSASAATQSTFDSITNNTPFYGPSDCVGSSANGGDPTQPTGSSTIVLDPGHAPGTDETVDPATKLPVFDYANTPEMNEVWQVAQDVKTKLTNDGYNVLITKSSVNDSSTDLKKRAEVGNSANAALAVSLHTTPAPGNQIYYPGVGDYVVATDGTKDTYSDAQLAGTDKQDAASMAQSLKSAEGQDWTSGTYNDLIGPITRTDPVTGTVMKGTMLTTQYFAKVPWIYVEQQQNAPGAAVSADMLSKYEQGLIKGIETIVPVPNGSASTGGGSTSGCCTSGGSTGTTGDVSGSISPGVGKGMSAAAQQTFQQYLVAAGQKFNVDPDFIASFYYTEMGRTGDSTNNKDAASGTPVTGDGNWIEPAPPVGNGGAYVTNSGGYAEPYGLGSLAVSAYGTDGNGDGKIEATNLADAVFTAANLLASDGGTVGASDTKLKAVAYLYNHSDIYAQSVLNVYNYLKGGGSTPVSGSPGGASGGSDCSSGISGSPGTVAAVVAAAQQLSDDDIGYVRGGLHSPGQLDITDKTKLQQIGGDCSGSTSWALHQGGMFPSNTGVVSGDFESWGQAGPGQQMTVWANSDHVFIEFNVPGLGHYELNTAYGVANGHHAGVPNPNTPGSSGPGPQFFKWGAEGWDTTAGFTPRHWPGT